MFNGAQLHLILNHLPIIGFVIFIPVIVMACITKRSDYKRMALLAATILGLLVLPAFWTGEPAEETLEKYANAPEAQIEAHEESAELALVAALLTSGIAGLGWFLTRKNEARLGVATPVTALAVLLTSGLMGWVGHEGGKIRHPEISAPSQPASLNRHDVSVSKEIKNYQNESDDDD